MNKRAFGYLALAFFLGSAVLSGCGSSSTESSASATSKQLPVAEQIRRIQANPDIPPPAKQAAIAKLQASQGETSKP